MVCVSGGKDSAALLVLLMHLQEQFKPIGVNFRMTAVHVDQKQPGYDGAPLVKWFDELGVDYDILEEDTYSVVLDKTSEGKSFCTMCSRLRRGILYSKALELGCNKLVLGHHADDSLETLVLNMLHAGELKAMPARYTSRRGQLAVMRPLITCMEDDIEEYARLAQFPILPCNLCKNQSGLQRPQVKLLLSTLDSFTPDAKKNWLTALGNVQPSHLLDQNLRRAVGMDPITGEEEAESEEQNAPQVKLLLSTLDSFTPDAKKNWLTALGNVQPSHLLDQNLRRAVGMDPITGEEEAESEVVYNAPRS
eukprot:CAMPEP_0168181942 /NCGR_PEP_ID=MMETSP0139_2-20121125/11567_1 /TAXON_ID=44445 /ORGANISM="Pseudo-nitzschia australis, Strain 10249 10 AB" /LENGTH=306 /DNA_ID=CAMNT_0008102715 /DNA_START=479 /DNA_END=1394 /DNA_ORIENTATION=-